MKIQELRIEPYHTSGISAQVINLQRYDVILGKPWLFFANPSIDWRKNTLTFHYGKRIIQVKTDGGIRENQPEHSCNTVFISRQQLANVTDNAELYTICAATSLRDIDKTFPEEAQELIQEFSDIFPKELPSKLLPKRAIDHSITLVPGTELPSRPTYRLSHIEMAELKTQLTDLMNKLSRNLDFFEGALKT